MNKIETAIRCDLNKLAAVEVRKSPVAIWSVQHRYNVTGKTLGVRIIFAAFMFWAMSASAQTIDCKPIVNPLDRLHCYDAPVAAPVAKAKSLREELSRTVISILE